MNEVDIRPPTLLALPSYLAGNVARIGHRLLLDALQEQDLKLPHFAVLTAVSDFGPLAQHELAERLSINRSHLVGYIDAVEDRGLVRRDRDPEDRRRQRVSLTPAGQLVLEPLVDVANRSQAELLHVLSKAERRTLVTLLARVLRADDATRVTVTGSPPSRTSADTTSPVSATTAGMERRSHGHKATP